MTPFKEPLQSWWHQRQPRERLALKVAAGLLFIAILWVGLLAPAWRTLHTAPAKLSVKQSQLLSMQSQAKLAQALGNAPTPTAPTGAELGPFCQRIDAGLQCTITADQVRFTLNGVPPSTLPTLLRQARQRWHLRPTQAQWTRDPKGHISGTITLAMGDGT